MGIDWLLHQSWWPIAQTAVSGFVVLLSLLSIANVRRTRKMWDTERVILKETVHSLTEAGINLKAQINSLQTDAVLLRQRNDMLEAQVSIRFIVPEFVTGSDDDEDSAPSEFMEELSEICEEEK